jgi:glycosyltransferase involved in cell wall biosynthesis
MEVVYFSVVRYPTEKAYGVTVYYSMKALEDLGHKVLIISPGNFAGLGASSIKRFILDSLLSNLDKLHTKTVFMDQLIFIFKRISVAMLSKFLVPINTEILWVRDPLIGLFTYRKITYNKIVLEVHQPLNFFEKCVVKLLQHKNRLIIAPISIELMNSLIKSKFHFTKGKIVLSPMSVPNSFFTKIENTEISTKSDYFNIGYVGGFKSSGIEQGILSLITCFQNIAFKVPTIQPVLNIYGIEPENVPIIESQFSELISARILVLEKRQNHDALLPKLRDCDAFILPYPEGDFFKNRFPLKALEYAALRRPILVTETISHTNIFTSSEVWFYKPGNCNSLFEAIMRLIEDPTEVKNKVDLAFEKAQSHSYNKRVINILNKVQQD